MYTVVLSHAKIDPEIFVNVIFLHSNLSPFAVTRLINVTPSSQLMHKKRHVDLWFFRESRLRSIFKNF